MFSVTHKVKQVRVQNAGNDPRLNAILQATCTHSGNSTGIPKLDQKKISSATNENNFFSLILLKYIHMTIC